MQEKRLSRKTQVGGNATEQRRHETVVRSLGTKVKDKRGLVFFLREKRVSLIEAAFVNKVSLGCSLSHGEKEIVGAIDRRTSRCLR